MLCAATLWWVMAVDTGGGRCRPGRYRHESGAARTGRWGFRMIIQHALKGVGGIDLLQARTVFRNGIICNWWRKENPLPENRIPERLSIRNLLAPELLRGAGPGGWQRTILRAHALYFTDRGDYRAGGNTTPEHCAFSYTSCAGVRDQRMAARWLCVLLLCFCSWSK